MTIDLPKTIRAVHQPDPHTSKLVMTETPLPVPQRPNERLIKVMATSPALDELGWEVNYPWLFDPHRERVPCTECAGIVVSSPDPEGPFQPGDEVFCRLVADEVGGLREYTIGRTAQLALKPRSMRWEDAGATPLSSLTAFQGLFKQGILDPRALRGDKLARQRNSRLRIMVTGAGGSVGSWAVQFAAAAGAGAVVAVCGPSKAAAVRKAGATDIIDYKAQSISEWVDGDEGRMVDMVLDCIGGSSLEGAWHAVKEYGTILGVRSAPDALRPAGMEEKKLAKSCWFLVEPRGSDLAEIAELIDAGLAAPWIDSVYEFEQFGEAFERVESGKSQGKVVIKVNC